MFKNTTSFKLVSILEEMNIKNSVLNRFKFIYKLTAYEFKQKIKLKTIKSNKKILDLLKEYFREYFYLYNIAISKNLNSLLNNQHVFYTMTGFNLDVILTVSTNGNRYRLYISYDIETDNFQCYIIFNDKNFNITETTLESKEIKNIIHDILKVLYDIISNILFSLFHNNIKNLKNIYKEDKNAKL